MESASVASQKTNPETRSRAEMESKLDELAQNVASSALPVATPCPSNVDATIQTPTLPKLCYFDFAGRGEAIRWCFAAGNIEFEDFRFSLEEWFAKYRELSPTKFCPLLKLDGKCYSQSYAIALYACSSSGLVPEDPEELMAAMMHAQNFEDAMIDFTKMAFATMAEREAARKKFLPMFVEKVAWCERALRDAMENGKKKWCAGDKMSFADIIIASKMNLVNDLGFEIPVEQRKMPMAWKIHEQVMENENIKAWTEKFGFKSSFDKAKLKEAVSVIEGEMRQEGEITKNREIITGGGADEGEEDEMTAPKLLWVNQLARASIKA